MSGAEPPGAWYQEREHLIGSGEREQKEKLAVLGRDKVASQIRYSKLLNSYI
jgi:hypothetical protein